MLFLSLSYPFEVDFAGITAEAHSVLVFLFFSPINVDRNITYSLLSILISWIASPIITFIVSKFLLKDKTIQINDLLTLAIFLGVSVLPIVIFPVIASIQIINLQSQTFLSLFLVILLQLWVILLSARGISIYFFIRLERAAIVSVLSVYVMVLLALGLGF
jgi:hypothetical protein